MSFLRKASLSRKSSSSELPVPSPKSSTSSSDNHRKNSKPPKSRSVSQASSVIIDDGASAHSGNGNGSGNSDGKVKRKVSLSQKGRKRLSSLFSSNSLSSHLSDHDSSPKRPSHLNVSTTASSSASGASTPSRLSGVGVPFPPSKTYGALNGHRTPPSDAPVAGIQNLNLGSDQAVVDSPASSPVAATSTPPGPRQGFSLNSPPSSAPRSKLTSEERRTRTASMYSQWSTRDDGASSSSSSDEDEDDAFLSAEEGLSEVEEGDEEEGEGEAVPVSKSLDETNVPKGATASSGQNVAGTGRSTIHRSAPAAATTQVQKRHVSKGNALKVDQAGVLVGDLDIVREVLTLFLTSRMREAEEMCEEKDPDGCHLYLQSAHSIIQGLKGMMTFDSLDLANALELCRGTSVTASALRKPSDGLVSRLGGLVRAGAGVARVKLMTPLERHAELVYAETSLMKAMLAIIAGGDWLGLVREALNMRTAHGIYRTLQQYLEESDRNGFDDDIDMDFRSGVLLGTGTSSLMLSLLPGKVLKIAEVFGYAGDRKVALATLMAAGGWSPDSEEPAYTEQNEGIRRPVCDIILMAFHLVISVLMPVDSVDIPAARKILAYNMRRYPDGVFFLYFQARLRTIECQPVEANKSLQKALDLKLEYVQLQHMCLWDYAGNYLMQGQWKGALDCYAILKEESNWSRAVYTYSAAACIVELVEDGDKEASLDEADKLMKLIPSLTKKIAGKSLPIEKLASRKARKFESQGQWLFMPALELAYVFGQLYNTPRKTLLGNHLKRVDRLLGKLEAVEPEKYGNGTEFWDDYALGHFLRGVVQSIARYPPDEAVDSAKIPQPDEPSDAELDAGAEKDFRAVLRHSADVRLDHYILYHCHYELGRLYAKRCNVSEARKNFEVVMNNKLPEPNQFEKQSKGKYSLEGALQLKTHAALTSLAER